MQGRHPWALHDQETNVSKKAHLDMPMILLERFRRSSCSVISKVFNALDESFLFAKTSGGLSLGSSLSILCDASEIRPRSFESMTEIIASIPEVSIKYTYSIQESRVSTVWS